MTQFCTDAERNALAARVSLNSFFLLLGSVFVGSYVLEFFGISLPVVRIAGGLVVAAFAWSLLNSDAVPDGDPGAVGKVSQTPDAFFPLTMPLTVGPGSISVAITCTVYICYRFAHVTIARLGTAGTKVVVRLTSFIMLCIGIQIIWSGWTELTSLPN